MDRYLRNGRPLIQQPLQISVLNCTKIVMQNYPRLKSEPMQGAGQYPHMLKEPLTLGLSGFTRF